MQRIAATMSLDQLKEHADHLTEEHRKTKEMVDQHAHKVALQRGHKPKGNELQRRQYQEAKDHYIQHELVHNFPKLHNTLHGLEKDALQARLAYKRAARNN